jgi:superfamily II DNA helicase RecQ
VPGFDVNLIGETQQVADALSDAGWSSSAYHAGMEEEYRNRVQDSWQYGVVQVVCATIAFGLGINKKNVRAVIHFNVSKSLEMYYQGKVIYLARLSFSLYWY